MSEQQGLFPDTEQSKGNGLPTSVLLPVAFADGPFDYLWDSALGALNSGDFVKVNLAGRQLVGVVWPRPSRLDDNLPKSKLKPILEKVDLPPLEGGLIDFIDRVADYTLAPKGMVMKMAITAPGIFDESPARLMVDWSGTMPERMTKARQALLDALDGAAPKTVAEAAAKAAVSDGVVRGLIDQQVLTAHYVSADQAPPAPDICRAGPALSGEQQAAVDAVKSAVGADSFECFLLDGVTGSGKTEVYFEAMMEALKDPDAQILVLLPEIALTSQWLDRFEQRFGVQPVVWHSDLGPAARRCAWKTAQSGSAKVIVGARSALFLPIKKLALIVVDEEHDGSFKQEEGVMYHARDMAVLRAFCEKAPIILASATPSMESLVNAKNGKYRHLILRERHGDACLPTIQTIDMRKEKMPADRWISETLRSKMAETLARGEQVILFLNRRGYAPLTLCRTCGHRLECPHCTAWLVEHRWRGKVECHHCGFESVRPKECPECDGEDTLVACGPGVERLTEEVQSLFEDSNVAMMTSDSVQSAAQVKAMVDQIEKGAINIIIGTQMLTKGYHFPNLTLVGVVNADLGLRGGDLRAGERTLQQLTQVSGRAGRADLAGCVYLQSYEPAHPVVQALARGDTEGFMAAEMETREKFHMPPFGKLVAVIISGEELASVSEMGRRLAGTAPQLQGVECLGPAPAPLSRLKGAHRYRMLLHAAKGLPVQQLTREWIGRAGKVKGVQIRIDVDPQNFS